MIKDFSTGAVDADTTQAQEMLQQYRAAYPEMTKSVTGLDIHIISAALMFGVRYDLVTAHQRQVAKSHNFTQAYTATSKWKMPPEDQLMRIYTDDAKAEMAKDLGVEVKDLYQTIVNKFGGN